MAVVTFYEKPGCKGNLRQKRLLAENDIEACVHDDDAAHGKSSHGRCGAH